MHDIDPIDIDIMEFCLAKCSLMCWLHNAPCEQDGAISRYRPERHIHVKGTLQGSFSPDASGTVCGILWQHHAALPA